MGTVVKMSDFRKPRPVDTEWKPYTPPSLEEDTSQILTEAQWRILATPIPEGHIRIITPAGVDPTNLADKIMIGEALLKHFKEELAIAKRQREEDPD